MARDIRYSGLTERVHRQLKQTVAFVYNSYDKTSASPWDCSACDILVADARNSEGAAAISEAEQLGIPIVAVADDPSATGHTCVEPSVTASQLTRIVRSLLDMPTSSEAAARPALVRLASEPGLLGQDTDGFRGRQALAFRPSVGRVFAARYGDLHTLAEALADSDWTFGPAGTAGLDKAATAASMSLESFYLLAADASRAVLPTPPADDLHLLAWPDLGEAADLEYPLAVADSLLKRDQTAGAIAMATGLSPTDVASCFWAFRAAGLIHVSSEREQAADDEGLFTHLFGRLRSRRRGSSLAG